MATTTTAIQTKRASNRRIEVKPIAGALGAEIGGVDLRTLDDETFGEIYDTWLEHQVVFFRDQKLSSEEYIAFAKRFGDIHHHPFIKGMPDYPDILEIVKEESDTRAFGETWHTDQMFNPKPAKATILYAKETPKFGGDTMFANGYLAYEHLSEPMKAMLRDVKTWNVGNRKKLHENDVKRGEMSGSYKGNAKMAEKVQEPDPNLITEAAHPVVRTHPETGKKALYVGNHSQTLHGMKPAEARPILDYLMQHSVHPEFTCRFRWEVGSMAIWDNRCTQHRALNDYHGQRRRMHRITIKGDEPV